jgi:hypothetical protein
MAGPIIWIETGISRSSSGYVQRVDLGPEAYHFEEILHFPDTSKYPYSRKIKRCV